MIVFSGSIYVMILIESLAASLQVFTISDMKGIETTAIFVVAAYISQIIQMPQKALQRLQRLWFLLHWLNEDYTKIQSIYRKSSINMNVAGSFFIFNYLH